MKLEGREVDNEAVMHGMIITIEYLKSKYGDKAEKMPELGQILIGGVLQELAELYSSIHPTEMDKTGKILKKPESRKVKEPVEPKTQLTINEDQLTI